MCGLAYLLGATHVQLQISVIRYTRWVPLLLFNHPFTLHGIVIGVIPHQIKETFGLRHKKPF